MNYWLKTNFMWWHVFMLTCLETFKYEGCWTRIFTCKSPKIIKTSLIDFKSISARVNYALSVWFMFSSSGLSFINENSSLVKMNKCWAAITFCLWSFFKIYVITVLHIILNAQLDYYGSLMYEHSQSWNDPTLIWSRTSFPGIFLAIRWRC